METLERIIIDKDWISLLLLGVFFVLALLSFINQKRLQQLFFLAFDDSYRINYPQQIWCVFNFLLFVISNLVLSLFIYLLIQHFFPDRIIIAENLYLNILSIVLIYWSFRYVSGLVIAYLFESVKTQHKVAYMKMSYFFSDSLYLLIFLIFTIYLSNFQTFFIYMTMVFYAILLLIRYIRFTIIYKRQISSHLFYFILYLCALEIAPLLIAIKIGLE